MKDESIGKIPVVVDPDQPPGTMTLRSGGEGHMAGDRAAAALPVPDRLAVTPYKPLGAGVVGALCPADLVAASGLGTCEVAGDGHGGLVIVRADTVIAVSGELLSDWHQKTPPGIHLECGRGGTGVLRDVIHVNGVNRHVIYAITYDSGHVIAGDDGHRLMWRAEWPD